MKLVITEEDLSRAMGPEWMAASTRKREGLLGSDEDAARAVMDALPRALRSRLESIIPSDMYLAELRLRVSVEGKPFGVGVGGEAEAILRPRGAPGGG